MKVLILSAGELRTPLDGYSKPLQRILESLSHRASVTHIGVDPTLQGSFARRNLKSEVERVIRAHPTATRGLRNLDLARIRRATREFDVAICYHATTTYLLRDTRIPVVLVAQDCLANLIEGRIRLATSSRESARLRLGLLAMKRVEKSALRRSSYTTVVSDAEQDELRRRYNEPSHVLVNGVDPPSLAPAKFEERSEALFLGNLSVRKNQEALRDAIVSILPALRATIPSMTLNVVGSGMETLPSDLLSRSGVKYTGARADLSPEFNRALVTLQPHTVATGIKNSALDSLAHGVPILASPQVLRPIFGGQWDTRLEYRPGKLAGDLANFLTRPSEWHELSSLSMETIAAGFSWGRHGDSIWSILQQVTSRH